MKQTLPLVITFLIGTLMVAEFFVPHAGVHELTALLQEWGLVIAAAAFVLGGINVVQVNIPKIARRERDWGYRVVLIGSALAMVIAGFIPASVFKPETGAPLFGKEGIVFTFLFDYVFAPANATMFALLAFFIASAAFRAFRARNLEATLMLSAAIVVMVGVIPVGEWIWSGMPAVKQWILDYANNAGRRAIMVGVALGAVATGLRIILGLERSHLGD
ncbi:MAG: hypothetical protein IT379_33945 [Deltaproteobacteria bacterium]|nr:hypothetical protein [Deltaproteobacteria bacterium]